MRALLGLTRHSKLRGRLRLAMLLNRFLMPEEGFVVSRLPSGLIMELDLTDWLQQRFHYIGEYEALESRFILAALPDDGVFLDIGANVGWHTLPAARRLSGQGEVLAFEPAPPNAERLRRNLELNGLANVILESTALSDEEGMVEMASFFTRSGNATMVRREKAAQRFNVPAVRFDDYARAHGVTRIDLIKLDVEGAELKVLKGMHEILGRSDAPAILCELNPILLALMGTSADEVVRHLGAYGYSARMLGEGPRLLALEKLPAGEVIQNVVFLKLKEESEGTGHSGSRPDPSTCERV